MNSRPRRAPHQTATSGDSADTSVFATLRSRQWAHPDRPAPTTRRATSAQAGRPRSWPAHGAMLDTVVYVLAAPDPLPSGGATAGGLLLSTPDTAPEAPNAGSHTRSHPAGLGNQVHALPQTPTSVAAEHPGIATIKPGQQTPLSAQVIALMPTPQAKLADAGPDYARAGRPGSGGDDLATAVAKTLTGTTQPATLLPTPTARDHKGPNQRGDRRCLTGALLPTPRASDSTKGSPHQHGSSGDLTLTSAIHLLPTPTVGDARSSAIQTVQKPGRPTPTGCVTLTDAGRLLPTPSVADALGGHRSRSGTRSHELLLPGVAQSLATASTAEQAKTPTPQVAEEEQ